ncbi:polyamine aminopropyltransferase [Mesoaciditoga sp.]
MSKSESAIQFNEIFCNGNIGSFFKIDRVNFTKQSKFQRIDIFESSELGKIFALDGVTMLNERWEFTYHEMIAHVPMFSHENPKNVLVIGGGDGGTVREVLKHPGVEKVDLVEIDPDVIEACKKYLPSTSSKLSDKRVSIYNEDGKNFVMNKKNEYDVIIVDSTDPYKGAGKSLFTEEFYAACRDALKENGVFSAEAENPVYDGKEMERCFAEMKKAFPIVKPYTAFVPMYPSGFWVFAYASKNVMPTLKDEKRLEGINGTLFYYNSEIHSSAFVLPTFLKKLIG